MFMLDANQDLAQPCGGRVCGGQKDLQTLMGMVNSELTGGDAYGGVTLETFASR